MTDTRDLVTFLFTDIEASTRLWEEQAAAMRDSLPEHDALLQRVVEARGGVVFKHTGDGIAATFASPVDAVAAAIDAQAALQSQDWQAPLRLRVRMAIHTGEADRRHDDWFGPALNRAARMLTAAHADQILVSEAARALIDGLPDGIGLRDLGEHRFRDLARAETVFQATHPGLPLEFPPLRSLASYPTNLPIQLTPFIGRDELVEQLQHDLASTRLLTLSGVGGVGKSRVAMQLAADVLERFPDGAWLVELGALSDPAQVPAALSTVLGLRDEPGRSTIEVAVDRLRAMSCLLIIDNCEHIIIAVAELSERLLRSCPDVRILCTSREGLGIRGELLRQVPPMAVPAPNVPLDQAVEYDSVALFLDRIRAIRPGLTIPPTTMESVLDICRRLDGIALAIELAAARARLLSLTQIAERLDDRFRLLTGGSRTALPRQRTLQATMDWSHDLLQPTERVLFRRLGVFHGGFDLEAVEAVCTDEQVPEDAVLDLVGRLVEESLIATDGGDPVRYRLLETVRQYAEDRLAVSGEAPTLRRRHAEWVAEMTDGAEVGLRGREQVAWVSRLRSERDNIRAGLAWCRDNGRYELGLRMATGLGRFWWLHEPGPEGLRWLTTMLESTDDSPSEARTEAFRWAGVLAWARGELDRADRLLDHALGLATTAAAHLAHGKTLLAKGFVSQSRGDIDVAIDEFQDAMSEFDRIGEPYWASIALTNLERTVERMGDPDRAEQLAGSLLAEALELDDDRLAGLAHSAIANNALHRGDVETFRHHTQLALSELGEVGQQVWRGQAVMAAAFTAISAGFPELARETIDSEAFRRLEDVPEMQAGTHFVRGLDALHGDDLDSAEQHLRTALDMYTNEEAVETSAEVRLLLARVALDRHEVADAVAIAGGVAAAAAGMGSTYLEMGSLNLQAEGHLAGGDNASAARTARAAARLAFRLHHVPQLLEAAETLAFISELEGDPGRAARLLASSEHHRRRLRIVTTPNRRRQLDRLAVRLAAGSHPPAGAVCEDLADLITCCLEPAEVAEA